MTRHSIRLFWSTIFVCGLASTAFPFRDSGQVVNYTGFSYVTSIATSATRAYVATTQGIIIFNKNENRWESPLAGLDGIDAGSIKQIWVDQFDERLFAETDAGKYEFELTFGRWSTAFDIPALVSNDRRIRPPAVLFPPFGFDYDGDGGLIDPHARKFVISEVVDDGAGTLWIGTLGLGLMRAGSSSKVVEPLTFGLLQDVTTSICESDSVLYLAGPAYGSRRTGITAFDLKENRFQYIESGPEFELPAEDIQNLTVAGNRLIAATTMGIFEIDRNSLRVTGRVDRNIKIRTEDFTCVRVVGDTVFAGTNEGLFVFSAKAKSTQAILFAALIDRVIYDLEIVRDQLWIASDDGAYRLSLVTGKLQKYQDPDHLLFDRVFDISLAEDFLWLSSDGGAVQIDLNSATTMAYRISSRATGSRAIAANDRVAAIASDHGLTIVFLDGEHWYSRELSTLDGLLSTYIYALRFDGDYLWVGTDKGLTRIDWTNPRLRN